MRRPDGFDLTIICIGVMFALLAVALATGVAVPP